MDVASATKPQFATGHARGRQGAAWGPLAYDCVAQLGDLAGTASLGFLYVTDALTADLPGIVAFLKRTTAIADWVGSIGIGIVAGSHEYFDEPAIALLAARLPPGGHRLIPGESGDPGERREVADWAARFSPPLGIVHADPRMTDLPGAIEALARDTASFLVGGLTSSRAAMDQVAGRVVHGGVSGVLLAPGLTVMTGLTQGCSPIGPVRTITAGRQNVVFEIDGRPALDVFKEEVGEILARRLERAGGYIHVAFPVAGSDTGDYVVRNLIGIDPARGWIAVGGEIAVGAPMLFVRRDRDAAERDLVRMLAGLRRRMSAPPRAGLYFSCIARGRNLFGPDSAELAIVRRELGDFPLAGMFCNGEISRDRVYGYTGVLALFA